MAFVSSSFNGLSLAAPRTSAMVSSKPVQVARTASSSRAAPRMTLAPVASEVSLKLNDAAVILAARDGDFGGYAGPILGILVIGVIIAVLTPPLKD